jgi:hypothetical protein
LTRAVRRNPRSVLPADSEWLGRLLEAADRAADDLRRAGDPNHRPLVEDIDELRGRLRAELERVQADV